MCKKTKFPYKLQQKRNLNCQGWEIDKWKKKKKEKNIPFWNRLISSIFDSMSRREGEEIRVKRHWISRWIVRVGVRSCFSSRSRGWYLARERACCAQYSFFFFLFFFKAARFNEERGEKREGWGIYSRRGVFFTLPATSARIDQLFIGRESGSTSLEERALWLEWIKGNSSGNYVDFSIFFPPWFVASFLLPLLINLR